MMQFFRKHANGPIFKGLMLLLALTFVVWGVGDVIRSGNKHLAFSVGDIEVSSDEWQRELASKVSQIEQEIERKLEKAEISAFGIKTVVLEQLINKQLLLLESRNMHLLVSDDMVKYEIAAMPTFYKDGKFDKEKFSRFLRGINMSEERFIQTLKEEMASQNIILGLTLNKEPAKAQVDALLKARGQKKVVKLYEIPFFKSDASLKPTEDELKQTYEQYIVDYTIEEKRDLTYAKFSLSSVKANTAISDQDLLEAYESKKMLFTTPEKRKVSQLLFQDEKLANKAAADLEHGKEFKEVSNQVKNEAKFIDVDGEVTPETFDKEISDAIFAAKAGHTTKVVKSPMGYHIFFIKEITEGKTKKFDDVKHDLEKQLKEEYQFEELSNMAQDIETQVSNGSKLKDIAHKYSLEISEAKGVTKGATGDGKAKFAHFAPAFSMELGAVSSVIPAEDHTYFIFEITDIHPKEYLPLESVRDKVIHLWQSDMSDHMMLKEGRELAGNLKTGKSVSISPKTIELDWFTSQKNTLPTQLKEEISKLGKGEVSEAVKDYKSGSVYVAKIDDIKPADLESLQDKRQMIEYEITTNASNEIMSQYFKKLREKYEIKLYDIGD